MFEEEEEEHWIEVDGLNAGALQQHNHKLPDNGDDVDQGFGDMFADAQTTLDDLS